MSDARTPAPCDLKVKLVLIGEGAPGKSSLLTRYVNKSYSSSLPFTIFFDYKIKHVDIGGTRIKLQIWDTAGQERFRDITTTYLRDTNAVMLVYNVADRQSLQSIHCWIPLIRQHAGRHVNMALVGTKCDLSEEKVVPTDEGKKLARSWAFRFMNAPQRMTSMSTKHSRNLQRLSSKIDCSQKLGQEPNHA